MTDTEMTRRGIFFCTVASLICAPAVVRAASLMSVRGSPLQLLNPERKIPKTEGEWYRSCFYNNLDNDLRAGRAMTYGPVGGKTISEAEGRRIIAQARAEGWLSRSSEAASFFNQKAESALSPDMAKADDVTCINVISLPSPLSMRAPHGQLTAKFVCTFYVRGGGKTDAGRGGLATTAFPRKRGRKPKAPRCRRDG